MDIASKTIDNAIVLPEELVAAGDKYRRLYAAMESVRLKHNTRAGDLSASAHEFRKECLRIQNGLAGEILKLRPEIADKDFVQDPKDSASIEPNHSRLKAEGHADYEAADIKAMTGIDLDTFSAESEPPPDPLEDFTGYTEVDSDTDITVAENTLTVDTMRSDAASYVYKDGGADHYEVGLEHYVTVNCSSIAQDAYGGLWAVTNVYGDYGDMSGNQALVAYLTQNTGLPTTRFLYIKNAEDASNDYYGPFSTSTPYYCTADWTGATTFTFKIYSDSDRTSLLDTLTISVTSGRKYRYVQGVFSEGSGYTATVSYVVSNLDLNEVVDTELVVSDLNMALSLDTFALTQAHTLANSGLNMAMSLDLITPVGASLAVSGLNMALSLDTAVVSPELVVSGLNMALGFESPTLTQAHTLAMSGMDLALGFDAVELYGEVVLVVPGLTLGLTMRTPMEVSDLSFGLSMDTIALGVMLTVSDLAMALSLDTIGEGTNLNVSDLSMALSIDSPTLKPDTELDVSDLNLALSLDPIVLGTVTGAVVVTFTGSRPEVAHVAV